MDPRALKRRVIVLGAGEKADFLAQNARRSSDRRGYWTVGYVPLPRERTVVAEKYLLAAPRGLRELCREHGVTEIVVAPDDRRGTLPMTELLECRLSGIRVVDALTFFEEEGGSIKVNLLEPSWLIYGDGFSDSNLRRATKRAFDVVIASVMLVATAPLLALTALAIWLESGGRGPILYRQERVGDHGRTFQVLKLRSMRTDAERDGVARWATSNDDRVTRVGRIIRKLRIDELPQLVNVLRGEMSFVGPRPERPQFVEQLSQELSYYPLRHSVKPGLTGWAQVRYPYGASVKDAEEKLKFDLYYVKNHSLMFDLVILLQTVEVVMFGRGAR
jgi:sugar transferase (PEP-CTERM system associated)